MSITNGFIILVDRGDHLNYLLQINSIFSLRNDPRIHDSEKAFQQFAEYYKDLIHGVHTLEELESFERRVDQVYLTKFFQVNGIADTDYEIKTKVRALYVSLYIQKLIQLKDRLQVEGGFFHDKKQEMLDMLETQPVLDSSQTLLTVTDPMDQISFTRFFTVLQEAQRWQTHAKWEKFAFYVASMAVGEGIWYCPGGAAKPETLRRKHLFAIMEKVANKYHKSTKKRKTTVSSDGNGKMDGLHKDQQQQQQQRHLPQSQSVHNMLSPSGNAEKPKTGTSVIVPLIGYNNGLYVTTPALPQSLSLSLSAKKKHVGVSLPLDQMSLVTDPTGRLSNTLTESVAIPPPSVTSTSTSSTKLFSSSLNNRLSFDSGLTVATSSSSSSLSNLSSTAGSLGSTLPAGDPLDKLSLLADVALLGSSETRFGNNHRSMFDRPRPPTEDLTRLLDNRA
jgi:antitoxin component YwqK of YwqJK toxin-antitoxin module